VLGGAVLTGARLEGANLSKAELRGADLSEARLQGAQLDDGLLELTLLRQAHVWRATGAQCDNAQVMEAQIAVPPAAVQIERFIEEVGREVPEQAKQGLQARLRERLITDTIDDQANERVWRDCESKATNRDEWEKSRAGYLIELVCSLKADDRAMYVTEAISLRLPPGLR
jgi:hypothetical protein